MLYCSYCISSLQQRANYLTTMSWALQSSHSSPQSDHSVYANAQLTTTKQVSMDGVSKSIFDSNNCLTHSLNITKLVYVGAVCEELRMTIPLPSWSLNCRISHCLRISLLIPCISERLMKLAESTCEVETQKMIDILLESVCVFRTGVSHYCGPLCLCSIKCNISHSHLTQMG